MPRPRTHPDFPMSSDSDLTKTSLKLPVVIAVVTGLVTSTVSITAGWFLLVGRVERNEQRTSDLAAAIAHADTRHEAELKQLDVRVRTQETKVTADIAAMRVQQAEDGKKLDLLLRLATERRP